MTDIQTPIELTLEFSLHADDVQVRWDSYASGKPVSHLLPPYRHDTLLLMLRALNVLQYPNYPTADTDWQASYFAFGDDEQAALVTMDLWDASGRIHPEAHKRVGQALYRALSADVRAVAALAAVRSKATDTNQPLALALCFPPEAVELAALPWEVLWDDGPTPLLLSRGQLATCARHLDLPQAVPPPRTSRGPLRILCISPQTGIPDDLRAEERAARMDALRPLLDCGKATMDEISPATRRALVDAVQRGDPYDIVHYYGHGKYQDGEGALLFDGPNRTVDWMRASELSVLFGGVRLIVLHACQGAAVGTAGLLTGIAPALSATGVPLVIGMQLTTRAESAVRASGIIYSALVEGRSVQAALNLVRQSLFAEERDHASWYVPVLYVCSRQSGPIYLTKEPIPDQAVAPVRQIVAAPSTDAPAELASPVPERRPAALQPVLAGMLEEVDRRLAPYAGDFVGRAFVRDAMQQFLAVQSSATLVLVGPPGIGKTALAAQLVREHMQSDQPYLAYFCGMSGGDNPFQFCTTLAEQLFDLLGDDYRLPSGDAQHLTIQASVNMRQVSGASSVAALPLGVAEMHPREAFRQLVLAPLQTYDVLHGLERRGRSLVLVLDALDLAWEWDGGQDANIVAILANAASDLPKWVKLVCTARPGAAIQALRAQGGVRTFDMPGQGIENLSDIAHYFHERFLARLSADQCAQLQQLLVAANPETADNPEDQLAAFVRAAVAASQGNFLFARQYAAAWQAMLRRDAERPAPDPAALLRFDTDTLAAMLATTYATTLADLRTTLDADQDDADQDILAALAIAFQPLDLVLLESMTGRTPNAIHPALGRLAPILTVGGEGALQTYAIADPGLAGYVRQEHADDGRAWDVRVAEALEWADNESALLHDYRERYRWAHLLRGLDLAGRIRTSGPASVRWNELSAQVQALARDTVTQAQLLRALAVRALDPANSDVEGIWAVGLEGLRVVEKLLRRSRALTNQPRRSWRRAVAEEPSPELLELERVLIAQGDAYADIARRVDPGQRPAPPGGLGGLVYLFWDVIARLPLTLYLLLILLLSGVREIRIPGVLSNLGRAQDWTVARLCVLSVSAYRRAHSLVHIQAGTTEAIVEDLAERLAALYMLMGAYEAAGAAYATLLARPETRARPWQQALWSLALGEALLAQQQPSQALEMLLSALPIFAARQAPLQQARAWAAIAAAHYARAARSSDQLAATLIDQSLESYSAALVAWGNVATLQGDEGANVDPALAISNIAHQLWQISRSQQVNAEQRRCTRALLGAINERHYPQRFEHPVLRLFRFSAVVLLPVSLLLGLLLAVRLPGAGQVRTQSALSYPPPLLDLTRFPNDLVAGRASALTTADASAFSVSNLTRLANSQVSLQPSAPRLDPLGTTVVITIMGLYLLFYTLFGLLLVALSSSSEFQRRRPGRLILRKDSLRWYGSARQRSLMDVLASLGRAARQRIPGRADHATGAAAPSLRAMPGLPLIALSKIADVVTLDRRAFGYLIPEFSQTLVLLPAVRAPVRIPGTLVHYEELCDELDRRLPCTRRHYGSDLVRSWWGGWFLLSLVYTLALVALLPLVPWLLNRPLPLVGYSLVNLYIVAVPGLLIPLLWWFVARPLGARSAASVGSMALIATALAALLVVTVLIAQIDLAATGIRPDMATPSLAAGLLLALVCYAAPRPLRRLLAPRPSAWARGLLALLALLALVLVGWQIVTTLRWYNALLQGNRLVVQALDSGSCLNSTDGCPLLDQAISAYDTVICLRPGDGDGYALRGFAYLARHNFEAARDDFRQAVGERARSSVCANGTIPQPSASQRSNLYANIGALETLLARQPPLSRADQHYQNALHSYAQALLLNDTGSEPSCASLALRLLQPEGLPGTGLGLNLLESRAATINAEQAPVLLQLADACYSRGSARAELLVDIIQRRGTERNSMRQSAWIDLAAAIVEYRAVISASAAATDQELGWRGIAAAWLALSQLEQPPEGAPDRHTALLQAIAAYQYLEQAGQRDPGVYIGQAWSSIQIGAWDSAKEPLAAASALAPGDPTYPALQGLVAWLDSTQYPVPKKGAPSPGYAAAISSALGFYSQVIALGQIELPRAYATRSLLYFSMRNSPRGETYVDEDYEAWMRLALFDAEQALLESKRSGLPPERQVGYRYWRGRLSLTLAQIWQEKSRGLHMWADLVPLYSSAYQDFSNAASADLNPERRKIFRDTWIPWSSKMLVNATHMQFAQDAARQGDFTHARAELALVDPQPAAFVTWDVLSAPLPDYHYLHGLISLGLGLPADFRNPLIQPATAQADASDAEADYIEAIAATEDADRVPQPHENYPYDARPAIYQAALADLDTLLARPPSGWPPRARQAAERVRTRVEARLAGLAAEQ